MKTLDHHVVCYHYLNQLYRETVPVPHQANSIPETHGEVLYQSVDQLISLMQLTDEDVFVDFGSGCGKLVNQVFLKSPVQEALGIEILSQLHDQALAAAETMQRDLPEFFDNYRKCHFMQGDFLAMPLHHASVVFIGSTCFDRALMHSVSKLIENTHTIRLALSLRPLPSLYRLSFKKTVRVECSWDSALCYLYE